MGAETKTALQLGVFPDADKVAVSMRGGFVALGSDLVLQARTGLAGFKNETGVQADYDIVPDPDTHIALVEPEIAVQSALGLVSQHDTIIFKELAERERYLREHASEPVEPNTFTDFSAPREILKRLILTIGEAALRFFPEEKRDPDSLAAKLAYDMGRL
jgi:hypothetical protein